jgi:hypothetical protein
MRRVPPSRIVEALDIIEHVGLRVIAGPIRRILYQISAIKKLISRPCEEPWFRPVTSCLRGARAVRVWHAFSRVGNGG